MTSQQKQTSVVQAADKSRADALTDEQIDKIADEAIKRVAGERISYGQARRFARAILAAAPTPPADAAAGRLRDGTPLDKSVVHRLAVQMGIIPADAAAAPGDERAVEEAGAPTGIYDGDTPESRAAFRDYDRRELVRTRSKWQVWRDACAWQASAAVSQPAAPADERAALAIGGYFVYDPAGNYFERFDTDTERDAAHHDAINEYRRGAQYDQEWSEDVEQIISGIVTHTTGELKVDEDCYDYAPRAAASQPETKPTEAEILDLIYECNLGGATEQQAMDFANRLLNF